MSRFFMSETHDGQIILNERQLKVLSQTGTHGVTDKYKHVSTLDIVSRLQGDGFELKSCAVSGVRKASKDGFQKHRVTLAHKDFSLLDVGDLQPQIEITNSYDGLSSYLLCLIVKRKVCSNGLCIPSYFATFRFRHVGADLMSQINAAVAQVKTQGVEVSNWIKGLQGTILTQDQQTQFATRAVALLDLAKIETVTLEDGSQRTTSTTVYVNEILKRRPAYDAGDSLWVIFNALQERLLRGGIRYRVETIDENGIKTTRSNTTRYVNSIDTQKRLNVGLADLTKEFIAA